MMAIQELRKVYVNIFDVVDVLRDDPENGTVRRFGNINELRQYTFSTHKVISRDQAKVGGAIRDLLRQFF